MAYEGYQAYEGYKSPVNPTSSQFNGPTQYHPGKWIKAHVVQAGHTVAFTGSMAGAGGIIWGHKTGDGNGPANIMTFTSSGSLHLDSADGGMTATSGTLYEFSLQEVTTLGGSATVLMTEKAAVKP